MAIKQAVTLLGVQQVLNIWNHDILRASLPANIARDLINCQKFLKRQLILNVGKFCTYCHVYYKNANRFELDHFVLKSAANGGGKYSYETKNILLVCGYCNSEKGAIKTVTDESMVAATNYSLLVFTHFHPNLHNKDEHFKFLSASVEAQDELGKAFLKLIDYFDYNTSQKILRNLEIRQANNSLIEDRVKLISSTVRIQSQAV